MDKLDGGEPFILVQLLNSHIVEIPIIYIYYYIKNTGRGYLLINMIIYRELIE